MCRKNEGRGRIRSKRAEREVGGGHQHTIVWTERKRPGQPARGTARRGGGGVQSGGGKVGGELFSPGPRAQEPCAGRARGPATGGGDSAERAREPASPTDGGRDRLPPPAGVACWEEGQERGTHRGGPSWPWRRHRPPDGGGEARGRRRRAGAVSQARGLGGRPLPPAGRGDLSLARARTGDASPASERAKGPRAIARPLAPSLVRPSPSGQVGPRATGGRREEEEAGRTSVRMVAMAISSSFANDDMVLGGGPEGASVGSTEADGRGRGCALGGQTG